MTSQIDILDKDIAFLSQSEAIQNILRVLNFTTGLRISLVARVTPDSWKACAVLDEANFGLHAGDNLEVETTFCNVVVKTQAPVLINNAKTHPYYGNHVAVGMYNVENYIAVPLNLRDGRYFGVLCALDVVPFEAKLGDHNLTVFNLFSQLVAYELEAEYERQSREAEISALNDVISIAAHDLRQPLTALQLRAHLAARMARRDGVSKEMQTMLDNLVLDVRRTTALTDILLDVGRIEAGNFRIDLGEVDLVRLILKSVDDLEKGIVGASFTLEIPAELNLQGDEVRLGQVIRNLLDNAIKYSPGATQPVEVRLSVIPGEKIFLQVRDYGMGVKESDLNKLFERQFRTEEARESGISGSGFGLYISQKIVEAHDGQIWADLPLGGGLRFNVTLPLTHSVKEFFD